MLRTVKGVPRQANRCQIEGSANVGCVQAAVDKDRLFRLCLLLCGPISVSLLSHKICLLCGFTLVSLSLAIWPGSYYARR